MKLDHLIIAAGLLLVSIFLLLWRIDAMHDEARSLVLVLQATTKSNQQLIDEINARQKRLAWAMRNSTIVQGVGRGGE